MPRPPLPFTKRFDVALAPRRGRVLEAVGSWPPEAQIKWFARYLPMLREQWESLPLWEREPLHLDTYYVQSTDHKGECCPYCHDGIIHANKKPPTKCCCDWKLLR